MPENTNDRRALQQSMEEVVVLAPDDPRREEIEQLVVDLGSRQQTDGEWAEQMWCGLLAETEALHSAVPAAIDPPDLPAGLEQRLLTICDSDTVSQPERRSHRWFWSIVAVAAIILISVVAGVLRHASQNSRSHTLAVLAINNHVNHIDDHEVSVLTSNAAEVEFALSKQLPFRVVVPDLGDRYQLVAGRKCKLGSHPVAYTLWEGEAGNLSLFQCRSSDFANAIFSFDALGSDAPERIQVRDVAISEQLDTVLIWSNESSTYVLVADPKSALDQVGPIHEGKSK